MKPRIVANELKSRGYHGRYVWSTAVALKSLRYGRRGNAQYRSTLLCWVARYKPSSGQRAKISASVRRNNRGSTIL